MFFNERNAGYEKGAMGKERGDLPAANPCSHPLCPDSQHLLLDPMKCHQEQKGGGADVGIRMLPALDY